MYLGSVRDNLPERTISLMSSFGEYADKVAAVAE